MEQPPRPPHQPAGLPPSMRRAGTPPRPAPPRPAPRPSIPQSPPPPVPAPPPAKRPKGKKIFTFAALGVGILSSMMIIVGIVLGMTKLIAGGEVKTGQDQFQAIFLTNNMVYFGKISNITGEYVKITNVYYLQVQQGEQKSQDQPKLSLAKLGNELHGPEDAMFINRSEVMFWENLRPDGKVVQTIRNHQQGK